MIGKLLSALGGIALCAATIGCVVVEHESTTLPTGTLTTTWSLDDTASSEACRYYRVDSANVIIVDEDGLAVMDDVVACEDFEVSYDLSVGGYSTQVTLFDASGHGVSDTVATQVRVRRDTETYVDVDFPEDSIF